MSSTRKNYLETFPEQLNRISSKQTFLKAISSSDVLGDVNKYHVSQKSEYCNHVSRGISRVNDVSEKSSVAKRNRIDCVAKENLLLSSQTKHFSIAETNVVHRKYHTCPHCDYKTPNITNL